MITIYLDALPPSVNGIYQRNYNGQVRLSGAYEKWRSVEGWNVKLQIKPGSGFDVEVAVAILFRRPAKSRDLDNMLKPIGDLLQSLQVIRNDRQISRWEVEWSDNIPDGRNAVIMIMPIVIVDRSGLARAL